MAVGTAAFTSTSDKTPCPVTVAFTPTHASVTMDATFNIKVDKWTTVLDQVFKVTTLTANGGYVESSDIRIIVECVFNADLSSLTGHTSVVGSSTTADWHTLFDLGSLAILGDTSADACNLAYSLYEVAFDEASLAMATGTVSPGTNIKIDGTNLQVNKNAQFATKYAVKIKNDKGEVDSAWL